MSPPPSRFAPAAAAGPGTPSARAASPASRPGLPHGARRVLVPLSIGLGAVFGAALTAAYFALDVSARLGPELEPRHRPEALCFLLAQPPAFDPPMPVQPSAALVRGRFAAGTPVSFALQQVMGFGDERVLKRWVQSVGDYDVAAYWLRLPGPENEHWLVLGWMEDADLAVCNFRFTGASRVLSAEEKAWGTRILHRVLVPSNFTRGVLPAVRLRATGGRTMPVFGPATAK